nr:hypothetical protein HUO10_005295 [Paraburkholderia busanensis]
MSVRGHGQNATAPHAWPYARSARDVVEHERPLAIEHDEARPGVRRPLRLEHFEAQQREVNADPHLHFDSHSGWAKGRAARTGCRQAAAPAASQTRHSHRRVPGGAQVAAAPWKRRWRRPVAGSGRTACRTSAPRDEGGAATPAARGFARRSRRRWCPRAGSAPRPTARRPFSRRAARARVRPTAPTMPPPPARHSAEAATASPVVPRQRKDRTKKPYFAHTVTRNEQIRERPSWPATARHSGVELRAARRSYPGVPTAQLGAPPEGRVDRFDVCGNSAHVALKYCMDIQYFRRISCQKGEWDAACIAAFDDRAHHEYLEIGSILYIFTVLCLWTARQRMEHLVRILNEHDRRTLAWARARVGGAAFIDAVMRCGPGKPYLSWVCRRLGLSVPAPRASTPTPIPAGERSLAHIREILQGTRVHRPLR